MSITVHPFLHTLWMYRHTECLCQQALQNCFTHMLTLLRKFKITYHKLPH